MKRTSRFATTKTLANLSNLAAESVRQAVRRGEIMPVAHTDRGLALFDPDEATRWARDRRRGRWPQPESPPSEGSTQIGEIGAASSDPILRELHARHLEGTKA